jgi:GTPase SAR1 family protein
MSLELEVLSSKMEKLYNNVIFEEKVLTLENLKDDLLNKKELINEFIDSFRGLDKGKNTKRFIEELDQIKVEFNNLYENFDDKLMIFIIGNGNVGKSTLLNALIGQEVAKTDFLPTTWKIDVYSPGVENGKAILKYNDGKKESLSIEKAKEIVSDEEKKTKESEKVYKKNLNIELKNLKTKEEREEMKAYFADKYSYKSKITEVRWPVEKNWILDKCHLVDTPGLNQNLHDSNQLGNIHDYYHKADGVLWLLDGQTISASNSNNVFKELDGVLEKVGGVRNNVIGIINRMDLVRENGGEEAVAKVNEDAKKIFNNKFSEIVGMSAQQAFVGLKDNRDVDIEQSGILKLQDAIRDIFILKADSLKSSSKEQGNNKLLNITLEKLNRFSSQINEYEKVYNEKAMRLEHSKEKLKKNIVEECNDFFKAYLSEVEKRVNMNIDALGNGEGSSFIENTMYRLDDFSHSVEKFIDNRELEIKNNASAWKRFCVLSEYKYINNSEVTKVSTVSVNSNLNIVGIYDIEYFFPSMEDDIFSLLGNIFGKAMFWFRKSGVKAKINNIIKNACYNMEEKLIKQLDEIIDQNTSLCEEIMDKTFRNILFDFKDIETVRGGIRKLEVEITQEREKIQLIDIVI